MKAFKILVEDNINIIDECPKNPLLEKWEKMYPKRGLCYVLEEQNITNYGCINCGKCPKGELFQIPEEDYEEYSQYLKSLNEYNESNKDKNKGLSKILRFKRN